MNKKLATNILTGSSILATSRNFTKTAMAATSPDITVQSEIKNQDDDFEITKNKQ